MNLYIDFDGVILDTIPALYEMLEKNNIDKTDLKAKSEYFSTIDWKKLIDETPQINDSIDCINKLMKKSFISVAILTHVSSIPEAVVKINYLEKRIPDVTIIPVPKTITKTKMVHTKGAILVDDYTVNLEQWESEGGIAVKFSTDKDKVYPFITIDRLDKLEQIIEDLMNNK